MSALYLHQIMVCSVLTVEVPIFNMTEITEDITVIIKDVQLDTKKLLPILIKLRTHTRDFSHE